MRKRRWPVPFALLAVAALGSTVAGCGGGGDGKSPVKGDSPTEMVEAASLDGVHSGHLEGSFRVAYKGREEVIYILFTAEFTKRDAEVLPQFRFSTVSKQLRNGRATEAIARIFVLPNESVLVFGPEHREWGYRPDSPIFRRLISKVREAQEEGGSGNLSACLDAAEGLELPNLMRNLKLEGQRKEPARSPFFVVGGEVDLAGLEAALDELGENPACAAQMKAFGLPVEQALEALQAGDLEVKRATARIGGEGAFRGLDIHLKSTDPEGEPIEMAFTTTLWDLNETIEVHGSPTGLPLKTLLARFGVSLDNALKASGDEVVLGVIEGFGGSLTGRMSQVVFPVGH